MTPRQSAAVHLPELVENWDALTRAFGPITLEHLATPDGEWGADPTADWPRLVDPRPIPKWPPETPEELNRKKSSGIRKGARR